MGNPDLCCDAGPALQSLVDEKLDQMFRLVTGLSDASLKLPDRFGSLDEAVDGAGRWRLLLRQRPFDSAAVAKEKYCEEQRRKGTDEFTVDRENIRQRLRTKPQEATLMKWLDQVPAVPSLREDPIIEVMCLGACTGGASNSIPRSPSTSPRKSAACVDGSSKHCPSSPSLSHRKPELSIGGRTISVPQDCSKAPQLTQISSTMRSPRTPVAQRCVSLPTPNGQARDHTRSRSVVTTSVPSAASPRMHSGSGRHISRPTLPRVESTGDATCDGARPAALDDAAVDQNPRRRLPDYGELPRLTAERSTGSQGRLVSA